MSLIDKLRGFRVPDFLPMLKQGTGSQPRDGGCVIQVCSYLYDGNWTDATVCVNPVLRSKAIEVNDGLEDIERQQLYLLIPRLIGTFEEVADHELENAWIDYWDTHPNCSIRTHGIEALTHLLDVYDHETGRIVWDIPTARWDELDKAWANRPREVYVKGGTATVVAN